MKQLLFKATCLICMFMLFKPSFGQLAKCKGKYFGNIISGNVPGTYNTYWNQMTSENASKWGSVEGTMGQYNFGGSDICFNWAKNNNGIFKYHNLIWGAQTPGWVNTAATATITNNIDPYFKAVRDHYAPMGGLKMIDVLNEPVNTPMQGNLKAALTAGYKADPANKNDLNNQYGWAIWCFQVARKYFPDATLLINEYNIEMNWNNCRTPYIAMVNAIKNAPNLTDGKKNLIDGVGLQAHGVNNLTAANFKTCIDQIWNQTGVAIHITEFDATADPNEAKQRDDYSRLIPIAWEHPHVAGITLWGYTQGQTWIGGNKQTGAGGTDSGIIYANGTERPAMTWLKQYFASQPSLSCCPAPGPFANCTTGGCTPPTATIAAVGSTTFCAGGSVTLIASTANGNKYVWKNGGTTITAATTSSYVANAAGSYTVTITNAGGCSATSTASTVTVNALPVITEYTQVDGGAWNQTASSTVCTGATIKFGPQPNVAIGWTWTGPNNFSATSREVSLNNVDATKAGTYIARYNDPNGCSATKTFVLQVGNALAPTITSPSNSFCAGGSVVLTASTGTSYKWFNGSTQVGTAATFTANAAGSYTVEVTNGGGCKGTSAPKVISTTTSITWYQDTDGDGKGDSSKTIAACTKPTGYVAVAGDACPTDANKIAAGNCGCNKTEASCIDCAGVVNGTAITDACGKCAGGTTGIAIISDISKCGATNGISEIQGAACVLTNTNNAYTLNTGSLTVVSVNWWSNSNATITKDVSNSKNMSINFPASNNGSNITITAGVNINGAPWYKEFTFLVKVGGCIGNNAAPQLRAMASPQPFNTHTTVALENNEMIQSIKIVDMNGIEVFNANEVNTTSFELGENFATGIYVAYITSNKGTSIIKLVKSY